MTTLKDTIEGFTKNQIKNFNQICSSKIYNEAEAEITEAELAEVEAAASEVEEVTEVELEDLTVSLSASEKLSKRPC